MRNIECQKWIGWVFFLVPLWFLLLLIWSNGTNHIEVNPKNLSLTLATKSRRLPLTLPCHFSDGVPVWTVPKSPSGELLKNGGLTPLRSADPSPALSQRSVSHGAEVRNITSRCQKYHLFLYFLPPDRLGLLRKCIYSVACVPDSTVGAAQIIKVMLYWKWNIVCCDL